MEKFETKFEMTSIGDWEKFRNWRMEEHWLQLRQDGIWSGETPPKLVKWKIEFITPAGIGVTVYHPPVGK